MTDFLLMLFHLFGDSVFKSTPQIYFLKHPLIGKVLPLFHWNSRQWRQMGRGLVRFPSLAWMKCMLSDIIKYPSSNLMRPEGHSEFFQGGERTRQSHDCQNTETRANRDHLQYILTIWISTYGHWIMGKQMKKKLFFFLKKVRILGNI